MSSREPKSVEEEEFKKFLENKKKKELKRTTSTHPNYSAKWTCQEKEDIIKRLDHLWGLLHEDGSQDEEDLG